MHSSTSPSAAGSAVSSLAAQGGAVPPLPAATPDAGTTGLAVLYDGACPLCRREIGVYQGLASSCPIAWTDVSRPDAALPAGHTQGELMARFHVRQADGQVLSGAAAFVALWAALPGWRWLARLARLPGITPLMELGYRGFLRLRPRMQRFAAAFETPGIPADLVGELRSDHAGETGAVWIYHGVLAVSRDAAVRDFASRHRATEQQHLEAISALLPPARRSWLLGPWRVAGFLTGALPALFGPRAVFGTIEAVERFVDRHYQQQIDRLDGRPEHTALRALLQSCQAEEVAHRDEAAALQARPAGPLLRAWCALVGSGSAVAVTIARRV
jgi:ubiquinone biosynthesis monooxygenase Coq7